ISSCSANIVLTVGLNFRLPCLYNSDLLSEEYSWRFAPQTNEDPGNQNLTFSPLIGIDNELVLNPVENRHAGIYECVVYGFSINGRIKVKKSFKISVIDSTQEIKIKLFEKTEGESIKLSCLFSQESVDSLQSADITWFKIKDAESFDKEKLTPLLRDQSIINDEEHENKTVNSLRMVYSASGVNESVWSIELDKLELDDQALYLCEIKRNSQTERVYMELLVNPAPPPLCFNQSHAWEACPDPDSKSTPAIVRESLTHFSLNLYKNLNQMNPKSNLLFSPISIAMLLSHLLLGTRGETRDGLERGLSLPVHFSCIHSEMKKLRSKTKDSILIANRIFFHPDLNLLDIFVNQSQEFYDSVPHKLTNNSEANTNLINSWVASQTQNRIKELVDSVDEETQIILLNAVYFIGKWKTVFEVRDGEFTTFSGELLSVPTLYSSNYNLANSYIQEFKAQVGKFPLSGKNSLYILLPLSESEKGLKDMEAALTENNIRMMVKEMSSIVPTISEVLLPKVKLLVNTNVYQLLKKLVPPSLFDDPNLCGMFDQSSSVPLNEARHRAFLSLTEKGVEAAAASSLSFSRSFSSFSAMRPFILILWNEEISIPLFIGKVLYPEK
ncbi:plasma protease C1 inhibitor precursor, partial [Silurus meridionalis]